MSTVDWARLQRATTLTIGLALVTAVLQTLWHRSERPDYLRLTRFFGTLLAINIAVGVVTGLVQEFQFGTNWWPSRPWCRSPPRGRRSSSRRAIASQPA